MSAKVNRAYNLHDTLQDHLDKWNNDYENIENVFNYGGITLVDSESDNTQHETITAQARDAARHAFLMDSSIVRLTASIIIPTYGQPQVLAACLESIARQTLVLRHPRTVELVIVEGGIPKGQARSVFEVDRVRDVLAALRDHGVSLIRVCLKENLKRAMTRNIAIDKAKHEILFFIDNSMVLEKNFLIDHMMRHHKYSGPLALLGFKENISYKNYTKFKTKISDGTRCPDFRKDWKYSYRLKSYEAPFDFGGKTYSEGDQINYMKITRNLRGLQGGTLLGKRSLPTFFQTNIVSIRRIYVKKVGGFEGTLSLWGLEDSLLGARLIAITKCYLVPCPSSVAFNVEIEKDEPSADEKRLWLEYNGAMYLNNLQRSVNEKYNSLLKKSLKTVENLIEVLESGSSSKKKIHRPNVPTRSKIPWKQHEDYTIFLYEALGYRVDRADVEEHGHDLVCEKWLPGASRTTLYVDYSCLGIQGTETTDIVVKKFVEVFRSKKDLKGWTLGILLAEQAFSNNAYSYTKSSHDIALKTTTELEEDIFMIRPYLQRSIRDIDREEVFSDYVPLSAATNLGPDSPVDSFQIIENWLLNSRSKQMCILGDFGSGKTTFLRFLHYSFAKNYLNGLNARIPLYLPLRDYADIRDGSDMMNRFLSLNLKANIPYVIFERFLKDGRFLLLLDGFDEMGRSSDEAVRQNNYYKISQLSMLHSKTVITCRPAYFVNNSELRSVFALLDEQMGTHEPPIRGGHTETKKTRTLVAHLQRLAGDARIDLESTNSEPSIASLDNGVALMELNLFTTDQIKEYINKHEINILKSSNGQMTANILFERIRDIYDLQDLAHRPILLRLIVQTLPLFQRRADGSYSALINGKSYEFEEITPAVLYFVYIDGEFSREYKKADVRWLINRERKTEIITQLAYYMFELGAVTLNEVQLSTKIKSLLLPGEGDIAWLSTDIRTCSFLSRDRVDNFSFTHKSFLEYFVAMALLPRMSQLKQARDALSSRIIPDEILYFLGDAVTSFEQPSIAVLRELLTRLPPTDHTPSICRHNLLNLLAHARIAPLAVDGANIEGLYYQKQTLKGLRISSVKANAISLRRCSLSNLTILNTRAKSLTFTGTNAVDVLLQGNDIDSLGLRDASVELKIEGGKCAEFHLSNSRLVDSEIEGAQIVFAPSSNSELINVSFNRCVISSLDQNHIKRLKIKNLTFTECVFLELNLETALNCLFIRCYFIRCKVVDNPDLSQFVESKGVLVNEAKKREQYPVIETTEAREVSETLDSPVLWNIHRSEEAGRLIADARGRDQSEIAEERAKRFAKMSWHDALMVGFPTGNQLKDSLTYAEFSSRLMRIKTDRKSFFPRD